MPGPAGLTPRQRAALRKRTDAWRKRPGGVTAAQLKVSLGLPVSVRTVPSGTTSR